MIKILGEKEFKTSRWSGGTTKELYIYPENGDYSKREFLFRLSIAVTEAEDSVFTKLYQVNRVISILKGKMELSHKGHHNVVLLPYEIDRFNGEWDTVSKGKVTDFNLMLKNCKGDFFFKEFDGKEKITFNEEEDFLFVYCISGTVKIEDKIIESGKLAVIKDMELNITGEKSKLFYGYVKI